MPEASLICWVRAQTLSQSLKVLNTPQFLLRLLADQPVSGAAFRWRLRWASNGRVRWSKCCWERFGAFFVAALLIVTLSGFAVGIAIHNKPASPTGLSTKNLLPRPVQFKFARGLSVQKMQMNTKIGGRYAAMQAADVANSDFTDYFGSQQMAPGAFVWKADPSHSDAIHVVVSISAQRAYVYEGPIMIAAATVSTGMPGHPTPTGVFPITEKYILKLSNLYNNAPMHFMQRLTSDGIALHAGHIPGVPASHGCIRLPMKFAKKLFSVTNIGTSVLIAD